MRRPPREPPDGAGGAALSPASDVITAAEIACDTERATVDLPGVDGIGHTNGLSAGDCGMDAVAGRDKYVVKLTAANDLDDLQLVDQIDVVDMLQAVHNVLSTYGDSGFVYTRLRDKIADDGKQVLAGWAQYAPSRGWSPPDFFEKMFRIGIVASLIQGGTIQGSAAVLAMRNHADECSRRLVECYTNFGVVEGAVVDRLKTYDTASDAYQDSLPFSEAEMRHTSRVVSLALIDMLTTPDFENEVMALIETRLPDGKWPPLESAVATARACAQPLVVDFDCQEIIHEMHKALDKVPQIAVDARDLPGPICVVCGGRP